MKSELRRQRELLALKSAEDAPSDLGGLSNEITSEPPTHKEAEESEKDEEVLREFHPVDPSVFVRASRRYLAQHPPESARVTDFSECVSSDQLRNSQRLRELEYFLTAVTSMYYGDPYSGRKSVKSELRVPRQRSDKDCCSVLQTLVSPLRQAHAFEDWSPREVAIFEVGLCEFGKRFDSVAALLDGTKTRAQIAKLYYEWKSTSHYKHWKEAVIRNNW